MEVFDEKRLERSLRKLPAWKQVAFMALLGARMLPNYRRFSAETGFGDVSVLEETLDAAWTWIESGRLPANSTALLKACEGQLPDPEKSTHPFTWPAVDAACVAQMTLTAIVGPDQLPLTVAASVARDTVDMFVQEFLVRDPNVPGYQEVVLRHPLMQRELRRQREDLEMLEKLPGDRQTAGRELRAIATARTWGSLDS